MNDRTDSSTGDGDTKGGGLRGSGPALSVLGDFAIIREIGRGGMGTVYEARQRSLDRSVAVKVLSQQVSASPTAVVRFRREAQAAAKLHHAHIVPIFGLGEMDGVYYYAMEYIDGRSLNAIIRPETASAESARSHDDPAETVLLDRSGSHVGAASAGPAKPSTPPPPRQPAERPPEGRNSKKHFEMLAGHIAAIADALDYAHREGVVHRDVKPHNLILGNDGKMRISDFGLARLSEQPGVTVTGELIGSPLYMSPEQITGAASAVDHRTDIYSLGATLYEWLTGTPPYPGETRERVISRILTTEPTSLRVHNEAIPLDLETICLRAIERDPQRRYQTAGDFRDDLRRFIENRPIKARRASLVLRVRKFVGRHQLASLGAVAALMALVLVAALFRTKREASTQTAKALDAQQENARIIEDIRSLLPPELSGPLRAAEAAMPMIQGVVQASGATGIGGPVAGAGDTSTVATPAGLARRAARDFYLATNGPEVWTGNAVPGSDACAQLAQRTTDVWGMPPDDAIALIGACLAVQPDHVAAHELRTAVFGWFRRDSEMRTEAEDLRRRDPTGPRVHAWCGLWQLLTNRAGDGLVDLSRAAELDPESPWFQAFSGLAMIALDRTFEAINLFDEAIEADPELVVALLGRARARSALGNYTGAISDLDQVLELEPRNADVLVLRGDHEANAGDFEAAVRDYDRAIDIAGRTPAISLRSLLARTKLRDANKDGAEPSQPTIDADNALRPTGDAGRSSAWDPSPNPVRPRPSRDVEGAPSPGLRPLLARLFASR